jgi:hypothetical protein
MSFATSGWTTTTTLSGNLLIGTGLIHCVFGLLVPELRDPLLRIGADWSVVPQSDQYPTFESSVNERYQRECAFWFQFGGVMMIAHGHLLKRYCIETGQASPPPWLGWSLTLLGLCGVSVMPASGFGLIVAQGLWILLSSKSSSGKPSDVAEIARNK